MKVYSAIGPRKVRVITLILSILPILFVSTAEARNGIYVTAETGWANQVGLPSKTQVGATSVDTKNFPAGRVSFGYNHDLNCFFGLGFEIGYGRFGKETYHFQNGINSRVQSNNLEFLFASQFHLINQFDLLTKLGGIRQTMSVSGLSHEDQTQIRPQVTLGGAYNFTPHLATTLSYSHVFGQQISDFNEIGKSTPSVNEVLIGIRGTF